jgi:AraC family transcriptional regulator, regulatory protein of adaptative response / methylated-DNA-[protein]-cysteine methyltransferase
MGIQIDADGAGMTASTKITVERALALIEGGALDRDTVERLAERLGIGARHLSRLCAEHLGASPLQVAQSLRIQRANA